MNDSRKVWISELEFMRGCAIIAVVVLHSTGRLWWFQYLHRPNLLAVTTTLAYSFSFFCVPLFIFISGFSLTANYQREISPASFYVKRLKNVIPPYLYFSIIYIIFYIIIKERSLNIPGIAFNIVIANSSFHLWFIALIVQLYLLFPMLIKICLRYKDRHLYVLGAFLVFQLLTPLVHSTISLYLIERHFPESRISEAFNLVLGRIFLTHVFYFMLGICASINFARIRGILEKMPLTRFRFILVSMFCISVLLSVLWINKLFSYFPINQSVYHILHGLLTSSLSVAAFVITFKIASNLQHSSSKTAAIINCFGKHSFGIYLVHILYIRIVVLGLEKMYIRGNDWIFYPLLIGMSLGLSLLSVLLMSNYRIGRALIGYRCRNIDSKQTLLSTRSI